LFTAVLPARFAVLHFEALFDRRFHVIVPFAFVLDRHARSVELPRSDDLIAPSPIVVGILNAHDSAGFLLHGLGPGRISLNENFVGARLRG
jgi:hypothetical protein